MAFNQTQNQSNLQSVSMYTWRLGRMQSEKRAENVNREILRRQHAN